LNGEVVGGIISALVGAVAGFLVPELLRQWTKPKLKLKLMGRTNYGAIHAYHAVMARGKVIEDAGKYYYLLHLIQVECSRATAKKCSAFLEVSLGARTATFHTLWVVDPEKPQPFVSYPIDIRAGEKIYCSLLVFVKNHRYPVQIFCDVDPESGEVERFILDWPEYLPEMKLKLIIVGNNIQKVEREFTVQRNGERLTVCSDDEKIVLDLAALPPEERT
jgi:hypothetical protein